MWDFPEITIAAQQGVAMTITVFSLYRREKMGYNMPEC